MPVPEGLVSGSPADGHDKANQKEGLQDTPSYDKINLSEGEEVVLVPLYGLMHDSPLITAVQKATRRGRRGRAADFVDETQWIDAAVVPFLAKILNKIQPPVEEDKKK